MCLAALPQLCHGCVESWQQRDGADGAGSFAGGYARLDEGDAHAADVEAGGRGGGTSTGSVCTCCGLA